MTEIDIFGIKIGKQKKEWNRNKLVKYTISKQELITLLGFKEENIKELTLHNITKTIEVEIMEDE